MAIDKLEELQQQRREAFAGMSELRDKQDSWTAEDRAQWDTLNEAFDEAEGLIAQIREDDERAAQFESIKERMESKQAERKTETGQARQERRVASGVEAPSEEQRCLAFQGFALRMNDLELSKRHEEAISLVGLNKRAYDVQFRQSYRSGAGVWYTGKGRTEPQSRAMSLTVGEGGYTVPEGFMAELEKNMLAFGGVRQVSRVVATASGNDMPWPKVDDTGNSGALLAEATTFGSAVDPTFTEIVLKAYKYSSTPIIVSEELLQDSAFNLAMEIGAMLGERQGRGTAAHFCTGDNSSKPQGIVTGSTLGVTAAATTAVTADELITLQQALDPAYENMPSIGWMMNKATLTKIRLLKADTGSGYAQYLWQPGLQSNTPSELLGAPVAIVQQMPAMTTGLKPILYGAFEKYIVRDAGPARLYRLDELFRQTDQVGFNLFSRHDGRMLQGNAIKHLIMA